MSTLNQRRNHVTDMLTKLHKDSASNISIQEIRSLSNDGFARVTASVTHVGDRGDASAVMGLLVGKLGNKVRPVADSFHVIASNKDTTTISGIVTSNPEAIAFTETEKDKYKALSGNMFMDEEENLWSLQKTEAGNFLIKTRGKGDADLIDGLMNSVSSSAPGSIGYEMQASAKSEAAVRNNLEGGAFITYVNPETEVVEFGAVVAAVVSSGGEDAGVIVASVEGGKSTMIDRDMVLSSFQDVEVDDDGLMDAEESTAGNAHSIEEIEAYYSRVFQRSPEYFQMFMSRWKAHTFA